MSQEFITKAHYPEHKAYEVIATYKVRHRVIVEASSPEQAANIMDDLATEIDWNSPQMDTLLSEYSTDVQEVTNANL